MPCPVDCTPQAFASSAGGDAKRLRILCVTVDDISVLTFGDTLRLFHGLHAYSFVGLPFKHCCSGCFQNTFGRTVTIPPEMRYPTRWIEVCCHAVAGTMPDESFNAFYENIVESAFVTHASDFSRFLSQVVVVFSGSRV